MAQTTLVMKLGRGEQEELHRRVQAADFELRGVDHARFQARGDGVTATLYTSGKLVVQGRDAELFVARFLDRPAAAPAKDAEEVFADGRAVRDVPWIGGDESGKGDYFGPLVVAAIRVGPEEAAKLRRGGVTDSKKVADATALRLGPALEASFPHAVRVLDPPEYNRRHAETGNVAILLSELYREVVGEDRGAGRPRPDRPVLEGPRAARLGVHGARRRAPPGTPRRAGDRRRRREPGRAGRVPPAA